MSETTTAEDRLQDIARHKAANPDGEFVTDAKGRVFGLRPVTPAIMFNVMELAGKAGENDRWIGSALLIASVASIDGVPYLVPKTKPAFLHFADQVGFDGINAIRGPILEAEDAANDLTDKAEAELAAARSS